MNKILSCLGLAALATLPTELLGLWKDWDAMSPQSVAAELGWLPVAVACQLGLLVLFGKKKGLDIRQALPSALGVELLLALRFCVVALLWALPSLFAFSLLGVASAPARLTVLILALAGAVPASLWMLRRIPAQAMVLYQGLNASQAIDESARSTQGRLKSVLIPLLLWNILAQLLSLPGLAWEPLNLLLLPLSLLISQSALAKAYAKLTL